MVVIKSQSSHCVFALTAANVSALDNITPNGHCAEEPHRARPLRSGRRLHRQQECTGGTGCRIHPAVGFILVPVRALIACCVCLADDLHARLRLADVVFRACSKIDKYLTEDWPVARAGEPRFVW